MVKKLLTLYLCFLGLNAFANLSKFQKPLNNCKPQNLDALLLDISKVLDTKLQSLSESQREGFFYKDGFENELITYLGSKYLPENTQLSLGAKACGVYMDEYIASLNKKKKQIDHFISWMMCIESDYRSSIPKIPQKIIQCYRSKK